MNFKSLAAAAALCTLSLASQAASVSAMTFDSASQSTTSMNSTRGYSFEVTQTGMVATRLGVYDEGSDGLNERHEVGLWTSAGQLLARATVGAGSAGLLVDGFRYVDISAVQLAPGDYVVAALYGEQSQDTQAYDMTSMAMATGLNYLDARYTLNDDLAFANLILSGRTGLVGGTLMVDYAPTRNQVPEPGTWALALLALGAAATARRRAAR